jgi:hypothetical protein
LYAFLYLLCDGFNRLTVIRHKSLIVAIGASAPSLASITIRTSKARMDRNLLNPICKLLFEDGVVVGIAEHGDI